MPGPGQSAGPQQSRSGAGRSSTGFVSLGDYLDGNKGALDNAYGQRLSDGVGLWQANGGDAQDSAVAPSDAQREWGRQNGSEGGLQGKDGLFAGALEWGNSQNQGHWSALGASRGPDSPGISQLPSTQGGQMDFLLHAAGSTPRSPGGGSSGSGPRPPASDGGSSGGTVGGVDGGGGIIGAGTTSGDTTGSGSGGSGGAGTTGGGGFGLGGGGWTLGGNGLKRNTPQGTSPWWVRGS